METNGQKIPLWWTSSNEDLAKNVFATASDLISRQAGTYEMHRKHARLYGNYREMGLRALDTSGLEYAPKITMNIIASAIDTAQSRIAKSKPRPKFLTEAGDYGLKTQGQKLGKFIEGVYYDGNTYREARRSFVDCSVFDIGAIKLVPKKMPGNKKGHRNSLVHERVLSSELVFDPSDVRYGRPTTIFQVQTINRHALAEMYPKKKKEILQSGKDFSYQHDFMTIDFEGDSVTVIEAWKTRSPTSPKGRHTICISNACLLDEIWDSVILPFEFLYYKDPMIGILGEGIARKLTNNQIEINKVLRDIQLCIHLGSIPKVFVEDGSEVVDFHLNNDVGGIIKFRGKMPESKELMRVPPDLWVHLEKMYQMSLDDVGLSKLSISGEKPAELESGKALREYNDIESERFSIVAQNYEDFHMGLWKKTIAMAKMYSLEDGKITVLAPSNKGLVKIEWKDVDLDEDKYMLQVFPTNFLSKTPSGKLADVQTMMNMGLLTPEESMALLEFPDIEGLYQMKNAEFDAIDSIIENIVDKGEYEAPTLRFSNIDWAIKRFTSKYYYYKNQGLPIEKLELLDRWVSEALDLVARTEQEMMAEQMPPEGLPSEQIEEPTMSEQIPMEGIPNGTI